MISKSLANKYIKKQYELENTLIAENKKLTDKVKVLEAEIGKVKKMLASWKKILKLKEKNMTEYAWIKYDSGDGKVYIRDTENGWTSLSDLIGLVAHAESHESGGTDEIDLTGLNGSGLTGIASSDDIDELSTITTTITSSATPTPARASTRTVLKITAQSEAFELQNPTGTLQDGDMLYYEITDDGTGRAITYDTDYDDPYSATLPTDTTADKTLKMLFEYSDARSKLELLWTDEEE